METSKKIQELRKLKGYSQSELATQVGVSRSAIAGYENGYTQPSLDILCKLCEVFGVSVDSLIDREYKPITITEAKTKIVPQVRPVNSLKLDRQLQSLLEASYKASQITYRGKPLTGIQKRIAFKSIKHLADFLDDILR